MKRSKMLSFFPWFYNKYRKTSYFLIFCLLLFPLFLLMDLFFPMQVHTDFSRQILYRDSTVAHAFLTQEEKWRLHTGLNEITPLLKKAFIAKEDKYFYYHPGVNVFALVKALWNNIWQGKQTSGASTITMQVVRLLEPRERTYWNKAIEIFRAMQLEWHYTKEEILQMYLNLVPYGGNIEGVKSASVLYFDRLPQQLSLAQVTTLTIIPNRPTSLRIGRNNDLLVKERNKWLLRFAEEEVFERKEIDNALAEPLDASRKEAPKGIPHLAQRLNLEQSSSTLLHTTIDARLQKRVEQLAYNYAQRTRAMHVYNSAVLVLDNRTKEVIAYMGSPDIKDAEHNGQVDGVKAVRSPGSALKPLIYAQGFDQGLVTPKSILSDVPTDFGGYAPQNFDKQFNGTVTVEKALAYSLNVPAVKMAEQLSLPQVIGKMKEAGFQQIARDERKLGLSVVLGGCGVSLEELCGLYACFANEGKYQRHHYLKQNKPASSTTLFSPMASYMTTEILSQITRPDLPHQYSSTYHLPKIAWKTGTSYGRRDAWSIGYNRHYTIGVWIGNFSGEGVHELTGADIATPLLFELFNALDYNSAASWYFKPGELQYREVCPESGLPPAEFCAHTVQDYFIPKRSPSKECEHLKLVYVTPDEHYSFCTRCLPEQGYKKKYYPNYPADLLDYYEQKGIHHSAIPPHNPRCTRVFEQYAPRIISPLPDKEYLIERAAPHELMLKCQAHNEVHKVYWYVNDQFVREALPLEPVFIQPVEGKLKISCSDDRGRNQNCFITVKFY